MIKYLPWDSNFFGFKVGMISLLSEPDWEEFDKIFSTEKGEFKLLYFITASNIVIPNKFLRKYNGKFINQRILYQKETIKSRNVYPEYIVDYSSKLLSQELLNLALLSGTFSRFKIDNNIPDGKYEELYQVWIKNSVNRKLADGIIVCKHKEKVTAMVTYKNTSDICSIGLVAVDESEQGKGTGTFLMNKVEEIADSKNLSKIQVPTQSNNLLACSFYEKLGFRSTEVSNYYHFWIK